VIADANLAAALLLGFMGGSHCLVMCGGIGAALGLGTPAQRRLPILLLFQVGRVGSYTVLGGMLGVATTAASGAVPAIAFPLRLLAAALLVAMGCYISNWWRGLLLLERLGGFLWRFIQPLTKRLLPVRGYPQAIALGICWGFLPCGLIYSALAWSATSASSPQQAALLMACFGLGTLPVMFATGLAGQQVARLQQQKYWRGFAALCLIGFGVWTAVSAWQHQAGGHEGHHHTSASTQRALIPLGH
jgi:sulfite exporter TauE/SafE